MNQIPRKYFSEANLTEEDGYFRLVRRSIVFIAVVVFLFIIWAIFTKIDEVAVTYGDVQPVQEVQVIQHLEGGIVASVSVKDGEEVRAGKILMQLNPSNIKAQIAKEQGIELSLVLDKARLNAFVHHLVANQIDWYKSIASLPYNTPENQKQIVTSIQSDITLLEQQIRQREDQRTVLQEKVKQKQSQLQQLEDNKRDLEKQLESYLKEEKMLGSLISRGYVSEREYIIAQRKTADAKSQILKLTNQIIEAKSALKETDDYLFHLDNSLDEAALKELDKIDEQLIETHHNLQRLNDINARLTIQSPITGLIKGLTALPGTVISPGDKLMEIVPTEGEMQVQSKLSTRDIGYVHIGDPAEVKITTYDFARYGSIKGHVIEISASTFTSKEGLPYYQLKIALEKNYVGKDSKKNILKPGMTVQADIVTNKKSIMSYILKPITRALDSSFKER
ncbi:MAG: Type I secretion membrane fusion protein, HlyD [uncultured bacterium]|nr:MAG: Type I secretion membrane fusion protein, HlyD [uncultured bacterium]